MKDHMHIIKRGLIGASLLAALTACGSGGGFNGSSSSGSTTTGATTGSSLVELGSGVGTSFKNQVLALQVSNLSAGGSTDVTANIVDANNANALYTQSVTVNFTSNCTSAGTAGLTSSVTTSNGTAIAAYTAKGCSGKDTIVASATVGTSTLTANATITVQPATIGTIQYISATPSAISMKGVGGNTSSKVIFQVNDADGNPVPDATVDFTLSTTAGGITLSPTSAITDSNGQAATFVEAGTVHTTVNVTATVLNTSVSVSTPNAIAISTGIPVQTNFSLSVEEHNIDAYNHDGVTDTVDVYAVDRYGNPASPGTNILFTTNSGVISGTCPGSTVLTTACGSCQTDATGHCSVTWTSEGNRPATNSLNVIGHAHILAYTAGEEFFTDNNGDGVFDTGDTFSANAAGDDVFFGLNNPGADDIGDPYMDSAETGAYVTGEAFEDINSSVTTRRAPNGKWYGAGCGGFGTTTTSVSTTGGPVTCANTLTMIGKDDCIVMSTDAITPILPPTLGSTTGATVTTFSVGTELSPSTPTQTLYYIVEDANTNAVASSSTLTIETNSLTGVTAVLNPASGGSTVSYSVPDIGCATPGGTTEVQIFTITLSETSGATAFSGSFWLQYTSANGKVTQNSPTVSVTN